MKLPKPSRRWLVVAGGIIIILCLGVAYAWGVFLLPIAEEFGWSRAETSLAQSILIFVFSTFMVVGGLLEKRIGPRLTASIGGALVCLGWILAYKTQSKLWLYFTYGGIAGIGTGLGYLPAVSSGVKWFPDKKGMITGIIIFGFGFGSAIFARLSTMFIEMIGWRHTMLLYGASFGVLITGAAQLLKPPPKGWEPVVAAANAQSKEGIDFKPFEMIKTGSFMILFITYLMSMVAGMMTIGHINAFAQDTGYDANQAATALIILAIANGLGRVIFGAVSDKIGRKNTLVLLFILTAGSKFLLPSISELSAAYAIAGLIGLCFGGFLAVYPAATGDFFGMKNFGVNYGIVFIGYGCGCFIGPWLGGLVYDSMGSYQIAFKSAAGVAVAGAVLTYLFVKPPVQAVQEESVN
ncbi:MAG: OFA family MFS transporter [Candidatus Auribacterota bacterium]